MKKIIFFDSLPLSIQLNLRNLGKRLGIGFKRASKSRFGIANIDLGEIPVVLYFSGGMGNLYQVEQWLSVYKKLQDEVKVLILVRNIGVYNWLWSNTEFTIVHCQKIDDLITFYNKNNFKCIMYVNNAANNFQSLINSQALHVHINHGESEKTSTFTNQSKAYDYVFLAGQAAYNKYNLNLIKKDMNKYIEVGRPQLDNIEPMNKFDTDKKVVFYAPTWEGTYESMNFSSLGLYGLSMVNNIIDSEKYFLVYKPHPNTGSRDKNILKVNNSIIDKINEDNNGIVILEGDINSIYPNIDIAIFDNSAVAIDYLIVDKPMVMTDLFEKIEGRIDKPKITTAAFMLEESAADNILEIIDDELTNDTMKHDRRKMTKYFLGEYNYSTNESTDKFVKTVKEIITERDFLKDSLSKLQ